MRQSEHVLYITLVDFLLQLLFLSLVLGVVYSSLQADPHEVQDNKSFIEEVKKLSGISDLTLITDELTRLGPLTNVSAEIKYSRSLDELVKNVGGKEKAIKLLADEAKKVGQAGQGLPACNPNGQKIAVFDAYIDRIDLQKPITPEMQELLSELNIPQEKVLHASLNDFKDIFKPLRDRNKQYKCVYNVLVHEHAYDTRPRDKFSGLFYYSPIAAPDIK